jgi:hypothetical protein
MKMKSSMALGVKSLAVKPFRLAFTILLSAVAFAVFGLFDTLANFNTKSVLDNIMHASPTAISLYGEYQVDYDAEDKYDVKLSQEKLDDLSTQTGYKLKGVYDEKDNANGYVQTAYSINELLKTQVTWGKNYYSKYVNGFVEFGEDEIENDVIKGYGYEIVVGRYPELVYDDGMPYPTQESLQEIAISTYLAKSILHYLNGEPLDGSVATSMAELVGKKITINNKLYTIVGLIDCGEIPEKYDVLGGQVVTAKSLKVLIEDFKAFIDTGAYKCVFVADGRLDYLNKSNDKADYYYAGDCSWSVKTDDVVNSRRADDFVYAAKNFDAANALFVDGRTATGKISLEENEVLIHPNNLSCVYENELSVLKALEKYEKVMELIEKLNRRSNAVSLEEKNQAFEEIMQLINRTGGGGEKKITVYKTSSETHKKQSEELKVVGVYVNVDTERVAPGSYYRFMMSDALMNKLNIYTEQGDFVRFLFNPSASRSGTKIFINQMLNQEGLTLVWYGNSALEIIRLNEELIKQGADLFLYIALVLAAFSIFMLFNYIAVSISSKRQSVGVLRALGSKSRDIARIFFTESMIISIFNHKCNVFCLSNLEYICSFKII